MASITAAYGATRHLAKAGILLIFGLLAMASAAMAQPRLLILGDSLAAGYGLANADGFQARLAAALAARDITVRIIDAAVSGDTTAGGRARLDWALGPRTEGPGAEAALVELGGNDGLRGINPVETERNLTAILDALAARKIPVLLTGMLAPPNLGPEYGGEFRAVFIRLAARPGILFDPFFLAGIAGERSLNQADGIHPNAAGVTLIVARLLPLLERLLAAVPR